MTTTYTMKFQSMDDPSAPILEIPAPDKNWKKVENYDFGFEISSSKKVYCVDFASLNYVTIIPSCKETVQLNHEEARCWLADMHRVLNNSLYRVVAVDKWEKIEDSREDLKEKVLAYMRDDMKAMTFSTGEPWNGSSLKMDDLVGYWEKYTKVESDSTLCPVTITCIYSKEPQVEDDLHKEIRDTYYKALVNPLVIPNTIIKPDFSIHYCDSSDISLTAVPSKAI